MKIEKPGNRIVIVCGHYGSGKTNVAVNLACEYVKAGVCKPGKCALCDLDIVNPYFRAADSTDYLRANGVVPLMPPLANTNVDIPSLPSELNSYLDASCDSIIIIDVGGDDGAVALGMYADRIKSAGYEMLYVMSRYRPLTADADAAVSVMHEIQALSRLSCTALVNNSSIGEQTTADDVIASFGYAHAVAEITKLPLLFTSYFDELIPDMPFTNENLFAMKNTTKSFS